MKQFTNSNHNASSQGIQSELPKIRTFVLSRVEDERLHGWEIDWKPYPASTEGYECTHLVFGVRARFCFVSHDSGITRAECIHFGSALVNGTFAVFHVNLEPIGRKKK